MGSPQLASSLPPPAGPDQKGRSDDKAPGSMFSHSQYLNISGGAFHAAGGNIHITHQYLTGPGPPDLVQGPQGVRHLPHNKFSTIQQDICAEDAPGTGLIFLKRGDVQAWVDSDRGTIWITGIAGAGKTFLVSKLIKYLQYFRKGDQSIFVAFAYLRHSDRMSLLEILAAVVRQLTEQSWEVATLVEEAFIRHGQNGTRPSVADYTEILKSSLKKARKTFYLVDALNEAREDVRNAFIKILSSINANICITSRSTDGLQYIRQSTPRTVVALDLVAEDHDIELMVSHKIDETPEFRELLEECGARKEIISKIRIKSRGMFLHASLQMEALRHCVNLTSIRNMIERTPSQINGMYHDTWKRMEAQPTEKAELGKTICLWVAFAARSLSVEELRYALAASPDTHEFDSGRTVRTSTLASVCCGLVAIDAKSGVIRPIHFSAKPALQDLVRQSFPNPHSIILNAVLGRLRTHKFPYWPLHEFNDAKVEETLKKDPFLPYAYHHFGYHVRKCGRTSPSSLDSVHQFVRQTHSYPYRLKPSQMDETRVHALKPVHLAAMLGFTPILQRIVTEDRWNVNTTTNGDYCHGLTPLMITSREGHEDATTYLLDLSGVSVNLTTNNGWNAMMLASAEGHNRIIERLLQLRKSRKGWIANLLLRWTPPHKIHLNNTDERGWTELLYATVNGHVDAVDQLLSLPEVQANTADYRGRTPLMYASLFGHLPIVERLLALPNIDADAAMPNGDTALLWACLKGHLPVLKTLLTKAKNINLNAPHANAWAPLMWACIQGAEDVVEVLLADARVDVNAPSNGGWSPLDTKIFNDHESAVYQLRADTNLRVNRLNCGQVTALTVATTKGHEKIIDQLLNHPRININLADDNGRTALTVASRLNHTNVVKKLLAFKNVDVNIRDVDGWTPLIWACSRGLEDVVESLVGDPRVDVNVLDEHGCTPLIHAISGEHERIVERLMNHPDIAINNINKTPGPTPLILAASLGQESIVERLIQFPGIDINARDTDGSTALITASRMGHLPIVKRLLQVVGIDVNASPGEAGTALISAASEGLDDIVATLLDDPRIDVNHTADGDGWSPLIHAVAHSHTTTVRKLLDHPDTRTDFESKGSLTAFLFAAIVGHADILAMLLACPGINVNSVDNNGMTALILACCHGHSTIAELLLAVDGVDVNLVDNEGESAFIAAAKGGIVDVVRALLRRSDLDIDGYILSEAELAAEVQGHTAVVSLLRDRARATMCHARTISITRMDCFPSSDYD